MNIRSFFSVLMLVSLLSIFTSCDKGIGGGISSSDAALSHIPANVSSVNSINVKQLMEKADYEAIKEMEFFQEALTKAREENPAIAELLMDPSKSGVNLEQNAYLTYDIDPNDPETMFVAFSMNLSDASAFEEMLKNADLTDIADKGEFKQIMEKQMIIAWNEDIALIGGTNVRNSPLLWQGASKYFSTTKETSIVGNKSLQKVLAGNHDLTSWLTSNAFADNDMAKMALGMANISADALKDNYIHGYADFKNGAIISHSEYDLQKGLTKDLNLFFKDKVKTDFSPYVKAEGLQTVMTAGLDIKGIKQVLNERPQFKKMAEFSAKEYGLNLDELVKTFNGDLLLSVYQTDNNRNEGLFATAIDDTEILQRLLDSAEENGFLKKSDEGHYIFENSKFLSRMAGIRTNSDDAHIVFKDDILFISGDASLIAAVKNGGVPKSERLDASKIKTLSGNIFGGYFDFQNMIENFTGTDANAFKEMQITTDRETGDFLLKMKDDNTNSLKQIFEMINNAYLKDKRGEYDMPQGKESI